MRAVMIVELRDGDYAAYVLDNYAPPLVSPDTLLAKGSIDKYSFGGVVDHITRYLTGSVQVPQQGAAQEGDQNGTSQQS